MQPSTPGRLLGAGFVLTAALAAAACATLREQPPAGAAALAGLWLRDAAASDDFERKLAPLLEHERQRMLPRHGSGGSYGRRGGGSGAGDDAAADSGAEGIGALVMPPEDPQQARARLANDLRPPAALRIALRGATVEISNDAEPARHFLPGQSVARIDSSGAASLSSGWDQRAFVVRAHYTTHATRSWRYELDAAGPMLRLSFEADDPEFGRILLVTRYRREQ